MSRCLVWNFVGGGLSCVVTCVLAGEVLRDVVVMVACRGRCYDVAYLLGVGVVVAEKSRLLIETRERWCAPSWSMAMKSKWTRAGRSDLALMD